MAEWNYIIIAVSCLLLCFLVWKEVVRTNKLRLIGRIMASVVSVVSLACIALPVSFHVRKKSVFSNEAILLTNGFNADSLRNFADRTLNHFPVFSLNPDITESAKSYKATLISGPEFLNIDSNKISALHVFGYGLNTEELQQLKNIPIVFHKPEIPTGITFISWNRKLVSGEKLRVQGKYYNTLANRVKIVLKGLSTTLDSIVVPAKTSKEFELSAIPKNIGRTVFSIVVLNEKQTVETEDIPAEINPPQPFQILMLSAAPDFENKFLKDWLSQNNYSIACRSRISKDKFQQEFINVKEVALDPISTAVLNKSDVLIADAAELASISKSELEMIRSQVQNKGLGLIIKADSLVKPSSFYGKNFPLSASKDGEQKVITLHLKDSSALPKLTVDRALYILPHAFNQLLVKDEKSSILVNSTLFGNGKIILTSLANTYTLLLAGNRKEYHDLWSLLLTSAARKNQLKSYFSISPGFPSVQNPVKINVANSFVNAPPEVVGEEQVYMKQDKQFPLLKSGTYWPAQTGWLPHVDAEGKIESFYVYTNENWKTIDALEKMNEVEKYVRRNTVKKISNINIYENMTIFVPKVYFFFIFVAAVAFLWLERRFS